MARRGELKLTAGDPLAAIDDFRLAFQQEPSDSHRSLLVDTMVSLLKSDYASHGDLIDELQQLLKNSHERIELFRWRVIGLQDEGKHQQACITLCKLADLLINEGQQGQFLAGATPISAEEVQTTIGRWVQSRLASNYASLAPSEKPTIQAEFARRREAALASDSSGELHHYLQYFGFEPQADEVRLTLARHFLQTESFLEAEVFITSLAESSHAETRRAAQQIQQELFRQTSIVASRSMEPVRWPYGQVEIKEHQPQSSARYGYQRIVDLKISHRRGQIPAGLSLSYQRDNGALVVNDGSGRRMAQHPLHEQNNPLASFQRSSMQEATQAQLYGRLMLVQFNSQVVAIDGWRRANNQSDTVLWRKTTNTMNQRRVSITMALKERTAVSPWGDTDLLNDRSQKAAITMGPLTSNGVALLHSGELSCVDPITGDSIWSRKGIGERAFLFGDEELLFVESYKRDQLRIFRMLDGSELKAPPLDATETRWANLGRNVLTWKITQPEQTQRLRLYDAFTGETIWQHDAPRNSRGWVIEGEEVAVLQPNGEFTIHRLNGGEPVLKATLSMETKTRPLLNSIYVIRDSQRYLLATHRSATVRVGDDRIQAAPGGFASPLVNGRIYAFERSSGESLWQHPVSIDGYGMPLNQPTESPALIFLRNVIPEGGGNKRPYTQALCIDRRDGSLMYRNRKINSPTTTFRVSGDPQAHTVSLLLPSITVTMQFGDEASPPEPTAQLGAAASSYRQESHGISTELFRAFGRGAERALEN